MKRGEPEDDDDRAWERESDEERRHEMEMEMEEEEEEQQQQELDADAERNLELLKQLGLLGPAPKKPKLPKKKKKEPLNLTPSRVSARIKGDLPEELSARKTPALLRCFAVRGEMTHSFRDIVNGRPEVYLPEQVQALAAVQQQPVAPAAVAVQNKSDLPHHPPEVPPTAAVPALPSLPAAEWREPELSPTGTQCSHCLLRTDEWKSSCATPGCLHGSICAQCLLRRYGECESHCTPTWLCPDCRGISNRQEFREERGWGAMGESAYADARKAGYASVAHWLVLRRAGKALAADIDECIPQVRRGKKIIFFFLIFLSFIKKRGKRGRPVGGGGEAARRQRAVQRSGSCLKEPLVLMAGVVQSLGVVPLERIGSGYCTTDYLFPIGFRATRLFPLDDGTRIVIEMEVVDGGAKPLFRCRSLDRPDEVFEGTVSSGPLTLLLQARLAKPRALSGPRMMHLDDPMVRAALHTAVMSSFEIGLVPASYRQAHAFYGVLCVRAGSYIAVRARVGFYLAQAKQDCFIMRADPQPYAFEVNWCQRVKTGQGFMKVGAVVVGGGVVGKGAGVAPSAAKTTASAPPARSVPPIPPSMAPIPPSIVSSVASLFSAPAPAPPTFRAPAPAPPTLVVKGVEIKCDLQPMDEDEYEEEDEEEEEEEEEEELENEDEAMMESRTFWRNCGSGTVLQQTVFHLFQPHEILESPDGKQVFITRQAPNLEELSNDLY